MPDDGKIPGLYERDFYAWSCQQARTIRAVRTALSDHRINDLRAALFEVDWDNLAEEIETLGRSDRRELENRIQTIIEHLVKLQCSPAQEPRPGWRDTVRRSRAAIRRLLRDSPSLHGVVPVLIGETAADAARDAAHSLDEYGEAAAAAAALLVNAHYPPDQVLGDWWPDFPS
jgi:hypothetical protein